MDAVSWSIEQRMISVFIYQRVTCDSKLLHCIIINNIIILRVLLSLVSVDVAACVI